MPKSLITRALRTVRQHLSETSTRCELLLTHTEGLLRESLKTELTEDLDPDVAVLEERILLSASPIVQALDIAQPNEPTTISALEDHVASAALLPQAAVVSSEQNVEQPIELVVIDPNVPDAEQLIRDLKSQTDRPFEILILNQQDDGITQISSALDELSEVSAIHIVSHGDNDQLQLGSTVLDHASIGSYSEQLFGWRNALTDDADLMLYGCNLAASSDGTQLVQHLADLTDADVAASDDLTGHGSLGGDWDFEVTVGVVDNFSAFTNNTQQQWQQILATINVTTTNDELDGDTSSISNLLSDNGGSGISLREAIIAANSDSQQHTIVLGPGTFLLDGQVDGKSDSEPHKGDLDILENLIIQGDGIGVTIIDGSGFSGKGDRIFHIHDATATIQGLTIQQGESDKGGAILVEGASTNLLLSNVSLSNNEADFGGALYIENGTVNLVDSIIHDNDADKEKGGGIYNKGTLTLNDVALLDNTAIKDGGGIYNDKGSVTIDDSEISGNISTNEKGGGIYNKEDGGISLTNVTLSNNTAKKDGGGIYNKGNLVVHQTTLSNNLAQEEGGGIYTTGNQLSTLTNVTISGNTATVNGGGIYSDHALSIHFSTIAHNTTFGGGGAIHLEEGSLTLNNSIVGNNEFDYGSTLNFVLLNSATLSGVGNVISDGSSGLDVASNFLGVDPGIDSELRFNGGKTKTHALLDSSVAIDFANPTVTPTTTDQRGAKRDATPDAGAYQLIQFVNSPEFQVNTTVTDTQITDANTRGSQQAIAADINGNYVIVWSSENQDGSGFGVYARQFNYLGAPLSGEILVNQTTSGDQQWARVAMDSQGNFVVTWTGGNETEIFARQFSADGTPISNELRVNSELSGNRGNSVIAMDTDGNYVIVWEGNGPGDSDGIFFRRFAADGTALDNTDQLANNIDRGAERNASIAMQPDGGFVITWEEDGDIFFQRFDDEGTALGSDDEIPITGTLSKPAIASDQEGNFTIVFHSRIFLTDAIRLAHYDALGTLQGIKQIASNTPRDLGSPSIAAGQDGKFVITYEREFSGVGGFGTRAHVIDGVSSLSGEIDLNQSITGDQTKPSVVMINQNNFVVVWSGQGLDDTSGVFARQFGQTNSPNPPLIGAGQSFLVSKSASNGSSVGFLTATDPDGTPFATDWTITSGNVNSIFAVDSRTGELTINNASALSATGSTQFLLDVTVSDGTNTSVPGTIIVDVNQAPVVDAGQGFAISETAITGASVGFLTATDPNTLFSPTDWTIVSGNNNNIFVLDSNTGELRINDQNALKSSVDVLFLLNVTVSDGMDTSATGTIVVNVNRAPTDIQLDNIIVGGGTNGFSIGTATAIDPNGPFTPVFTVDDPRFEFVGSQLTLKTGHFLDRNSEPTIPIKITVADTQGLTLEKSFTLVVSRPPVIAADDAHSVSEEGTLTIGSTGLLTNDKNNTISVTSGATLNWDAGVDVDGNGTWEPTTNVSGYDWNLGSGVTFNQSPSTNQVKVLSAYHFDGSPGGVAISTDALADLAGDPTDNPATFEVWFRPQDAVGRELIFESGAASPGNGISLHLDGSNLLFSIYGPGAPGTTLSTDISAQLADNDFIQFAGTVRFDGGDAFLDMYVNGALVSSTTANGITSWSSASEGISLGNADGTVGGIFPGFNPFTGDIAIVRMYESELSGSEIHHNFEAVAGTSSGLAIDSVDLVTNQTKGLVSFNPNGGFTYDPNGQFNGLAVGQQATDSFQYTVSNGLGAFGTGTVVITINGENDLPIANNDFYSVSEGATMNILFSAFGLLGNDSDPDSDSLTTTVASGPSHGSLALATNGTFSYVHDGSETTSDSFTYQISDGLATALATVTLNVIPVNDAPTVNLDNPSEWSGDEDVIGQVVLDNLFSDAEGNPLSFRVVDSNDPTQVVFSTINTNDSNQRILTIEPPPNWFGQNTVTIEATDPEGASVQREVAVEVAPVNDVPIAQGDRLTVPSLESFTIDASRLLANDIDVDNDDLTVTIVSEPSSGTLTRLGNGLFSYTPNSSDFTFDSFTYFVSDLTSSSAPATVQLVFPTQPQTNIDGSGTRTPGNGGSLSSTDPTASTDSTSSTDSTTSDSSSSSSTTATTSGDSNTTITPDASNLVSSNVSNQDSSSNSSSSNESNTVDELVLNGILEFLGSNANSGLDAGRGSGAEGSDLNADALRSQEGRNRGNKSDLEEQDTSNNRLRGSSSTMLNEMMATPQLWQAIDSMNRDVASSVSLGRITIGATATTTAGMTAGYVVWVLRGGLLVSSAIAQMPMWQFMDPLTILDSTGMDQEDDGESLHSLVGEDNENDSNQDNDSNEEHGNN